MWCTLIGFTILTSFHLNPVLVIFWTLFFALIESLIKQLWQAKDRAQAQERDRIRGEWKKYFEDKDRRE